MYKQYAFSEQKQQEAKVEVTDPTWTEWTLPFNVPTIVLGVFQETVVSSILALGPTSLCV